MSFAAAGGLLGPCIMRDHYRWKNVIHLVNEMIAREKPRSWVLGVASVPMPKGYDITTRIGQFEMTVRASEDIPAGAIVEVGPDGLVRCLRVVNDPPLSKDRDRRYADMGEAPPLLEIK